MDGIARWWAFPIVVVVLLIVACGESKAPEREQVQVERTTDAETALSEGQNYVYLAIDDESAAQEELRSAAASLRGHVVERGAVEVGADCALKGRGGVLFDESREPLDRCPVREGFHPSYDLCWRVRVVAKVVGEGLTLELHLYKLRAAIWWPHSGGGRPYAYSTLTDAVNSMAEIVTDLVHSAILKP